MGQEDKEREYEERNGIISSVGCECHDGAAEKVQKKASVHFFLGVEFTCPGCGTSSSIKIGDIDERMVCPACQKCEFVLTDIFHSILSAEKRPTPRAEMKQYERKERKTKAGRPPLGKVPRGYIQLSLHPASLQALYEMHINRTALVEFLLNLYPPYLKLVIEKRHQ